MARFLFILFIFANAFLNSVVVVGAEFGAAPSPISTGAETPSARKLGKHRSAAAVSSGSSPSEAPRSEMKVQATSAAATNGGDHQHHNHKASDKSIAGGGVILGGLATTFLVAIICYIRATRRSNSEVK
ncbi:uncharacterized protein LOC111019472 [Momordica charantia]|uniref:Uncharacterized protein LOC111019472 n=1 Tax=Momordica charantia TaxID=3673 RepID=A0A6J1DCH7_MOMCH|nr:uncharacterized protein LOC111019472 [Momordica charantia]